MSIMECLVAECTAAYYGRGYCERHYRRARESGQIRILTAEDRFWSRVVVLEDGGCWTWTGYRQPKGYGIFSDQGKQLLVHRWSYQHFKGPIPEGLEIDHLCRNKSCVNPDHLEVVTTLENSLRARPFWTWTNPTHCPHGHEYTEENSYRSPGNPKVRECRTCRKERASA